MKNDSILAGFIPLIALLALVATYGGLFLPGLYNDGDYINTQWLGQDFVTLIVAVPALLLAAYYALKQGSLKARIVLAGVLAYFVYTYAFFGFVAAFNDFYLIQVAIFALAVFALIFQLGQLTPLQVHIVPERKTVFRAGSIYLLIVCSIIGFVWLSDIFSHLFVEGYRSATPDGEPLTIVYTLDLGFVIPVSFYAAIALWRRRFWGYLLMGVMLVKTTTLGFSLMAMSVSMMISGLNNEPFLTFMWFVIGLAGLLFSVLYLRQLRINHRVGNLLEEEEKPVPHYQKREFGIDK